MKNLVDELDKRTNDKDEQVAERKFFKCDSRLYKSDIHGPLEDTRPNNFSVQSQIDGLQNQIDNFECTCDDEPMDQTPKPADYNLPADYTYADTSFGGVFYKYYGDKNRNRFSKLIQI